MNKFLKVIFCIINPQYLKLYLHGVSPVFELNPLVRRINKIKTVIDVGSNKGQFISLIKNRFPEAKLFSFEPLKHEFELQKHIFKKNKITFFNVAVGEKKQSKQFYITNRRDSSSLLKPFDKRKIYKIKKIISVEVNRLDALLKDCILQKKILLKIDVQGNELNVLKGLGKLINYVDYIILENSFKSIYKNQPKKKRVENFLLNNKFKILHKCNITKFKSKLFQEDVLYIKN